MGLVANISRLADNWNKVDLVAIGSEVASEHEKEIADYNRKQLFEEGVDSEGNKLKPYKRAKYARAKHAMNPLPGLGNPDDYLTGKFQKSILAIVKDKALVFESSDAKAPFLFKRDGVKILGLAKDSKVLVWNNVLIAPTAQRINKIMKS